MYEFWWVSSYGVCNCDSPFLFFLRVLENWKKKNKHTSHLICIYIHACIIWWCWLKMMYYMWNEQDSGVEKKCSEWPHEWPRPVTGRTFYYYCCVNTCVPLVCAGETLYYFHVEVRVCYICTFFCRFFLVFFFFFSCVVGRYRRWRERRRSDWRRLPSKRRTRSKPPHTIGINSGSCRTGIGCVGVS